MSLLTLPARGFTLVEVLVALVVLAVGLLGVAVLTVGSLRGTRSALERSQAANLAGDMLERIRANVAAGNAYDTADGTPDPRLEPACERGDGRCEPAVMASHDLARWLHDVTGSLPGATGSVDVVAVTAAQHRYAITVGWSEPGDHGRADCTLVVDL
jgi:type IV pilus assembly protein PilV